MRNRFLDANAVKHLRGDAIIEASDGSNTHAEEELAHALVTGKVSLTGLSCV